MNYLTIKKYHTDLFTNTKHKKISFDTFVVLSKLDDNSYKRVKRMWIDLITLINMHNGENDISAINEYRNFIKNNAKLTNLSKSDLMCLFGEVFYKDDEFILTQEINLIEV